MNYHRCHLKGAIDWPNVNAHLHTTVTDVITTIAEVSAQHCPNPAQMAMQAQTGAQAWTVGPAWMMNLRISNSSKPLGCLA
jgi:hypothetical protein